MRSMVRVYLTSTKLPNCSQVVVQFCTMASNEWNFQLLYTLNSTWYVQVFFFFFLAIKVGE